MDTRPARCMMGTVHGHDQSVDWCDMGSTLYACVPRLKKIMDDHPNPVTRNRAAAILRRRSGETTGR